MLSAALWCGFQGFQFGKGRVFQSHSAGQAVGPTMEGVLAENRGLKDENTALKTEIVALKSENESLKAAHAWIDPVISFVRLFKFQSATLGHSFLLLLPLCGVLVALSSLELTDWSSTVPTYNAGVFWCVWAALIAGGWTLWCVGAAASNNPAFSNVVGLGGWRQALLAYFPVVTAVTGIALLLCLGAPIAYGLDAHFYSLDMVAFIMIILVTSIFGRAIADALAARYFPHHALIASDDAAAKTGDPPAAVGIDKAKEEETIVESTETGGNKTSALQTALNQLLGGTLPICVIIGCAYPPIPARVYSNHSHSAPNDAPPTITQTRWPSSPCIRACSTTHGASFSVSWAIPLSWRSASSG